MNFIMLFLYITIPGVINFLLSYHEFLRKCRKLSPLFRPDKSIVFWFWSLFQILLPGLLLVTALLVFPNPLLNSNLKLFLIAVTWGFFFKVVSSIKIGGLEISISIDAIITKPSLDRIQDEESPKIRAFWRNIQNELKKSSSLDEGLNALQNGYSSPDKTTQEKYLENCINLANEPNLEIKVRRIVNLLIDYPGDNIEILPEFGVDFKFLEQYLSRHRLQKMFKSYSIRKLF